MNESNQISEFGGTDHRAQGTTAKVENRIPGTADTDMSSLDDDNPYEKDEYLRMYLDLHCRTLDITTGRKKVVAPMMAHEHAPTHAYGFPQRVAQLLTQLKPQGWGYALDLGCAVGGTAFELAKSFQNVDALDASESFIAAAKRLREGESIPFPIRVEGDIYEQLVATNHVDDPGVCQRVSFFVGNACYLEDTLPDRKRLYDGVVMANLLCRLPDPMACLDGVTSRVRQGGVVLLVTPFSWLEEYTPKDKWIGGSDDQSSVDALEQLMLVLGFHKIHDEEMPLVIREHRRKYQYIISKATGWRKVSSKGRAV